LTRSKSRSRSGINAPLRVASVAIWWMMAALRLRIRLAQDVGCGVDKMPSEMQRDASWPSSAACPVQLLGRSVSRGFPFVLVNQTTEPIAADDVTDLPGWLATPERRRQPECLVRPRRVVVLDALAQDTFEVALAEDQRPVQAFAPKRPDPALGMGPGAGCSERRADDTHALGAEHGVEGSGELRVAIPDQHRRKKSTWRVWEGKTLAAC
jgi:hypothetical protein